MDPPSRLPGGGYANTVFANQKTIAGLLLVKTTRFRFALVTIGIILILPAAAAILAPGLLSATATIDTSRIAAVAQQAFCRPYLSKWKAQALPSTKCMWTAARRYRFSSHRI
jgi:hypothetical protein